MSRFRNLDAVGILLAVASWILVGFALLACIRVLISHGWMPAS